MSQVFDEVALLELRLIFCEEAKDLLEAVEESLLGGRTFEEQRFQPEVFRALHCLKGSAQAVHFGAFSRISHELEDILGRAFHVGMIDFTLSVVDRLRLGIELFLKGMRAESFELLSQLAESVKSPQSFEK